MRLISPIMILALAPLPALAQVQTTIAPVTLPDLNPNDPNATYCRPPQHRTDSQLMGPKVCMTNKEWNELAADGFEIAPDGSKVRIVKNVGILSH